MAAAIPTVVGALSSGAATSMGAGMSTAMTIGMVALTVAQVLLAPTTKPKQASSDDFATQDFTARADNTPLPRLYGTNGVPANLVWCGNYNWRSTTKSEAEERDY